MRVEEFTQLDFYGKTCLGVGEQAGPEWDYNQGPKLEDVNSSGKN